ncbi:MAG: outer membrane beta-barrel protein [Gammaproteobacteria bacterium]|nr:outer membrane beta-barrel protein [Gammaproteobacteria bacterium]
MTRSSTNPQSAFSLRGKLKYLLSFGLLLALSSESLGEPRYQCGAGCPGRFYLGVFGGTGKSDSDHFTQRGVALFPDIIGGPLIIDGAGNSDHYSTPTYGIHVGYEYLGLFNCHNSWNLFPAAELEGFSLRGTQKGFLANPSARLPEHNFLDTLPMRSKFLFANAVFAVETPLARTVQPYVGVGIGMARQSISGADSLQLDPPEPGVNHFNSDPDDSDDAVSVQGKVGLRFAPFCHARFFVEYRLVHLASTNYVFGPTEYPTHAETSDWNVKLNDVNYHLFTLGIDLLT